MKFIRATVRGLTRRQMIAFVFGVVFILFAVGSVVWSFVAGTPSDIPGYALESRVIFRVERALALSVGLALFGSFATRLIAGDLPSGITTSGIEWKEEENVAAALEKTKGSVDQLGVSTTANANAIQLLRESVSKVNELAEAHDQEFGPLPDVARELAGRLAALEQETNRISDRVARLEE